MIDGTVFGVGVLVGGVSGAVIVGFWIAARLRARVQTQLQTTGERVQRAESLADELRRQVLQDRVDLDRVRQDLSEASRAHAVAETRAAEAALHLNEQKTLLSQARQELAETFQALSGEALKQNNEAFLNLARSSFETLQAEAKGDLAQRQQAIDSLVKLLSKTRCIDTTINSGSWSSRGKPLMEASISISSSSPSHSSGCNRRPATS